MASCVSRWRGRRPGGGRSCWSRARPGSAGRGCLMMRRSPRRALGWGLACAAHELERHLPFAVAPAVCSSGAWARPTPFRRAPRTASLGLLGARSARRAAPRSRGLVTTAARAHGGAIGARRRRSAWTTSVGNVASVRPVVLARRAESLALALIVGVRGERGATSSSPVGRRRFEVERLRPRRLSADASACVLAKRLGREAGPALRDSCLRATAGTPLLVVELRVARRSLAEDDAAAVGTGGTSSPRKSRRRRSVTLRLRRGSESGAASGARVRSLGDEARLATPRVLRASPRKTRPSAAGGLAAAALAGRHRPACMRRIHCCASPRSQPSPRRSAPRSWVGPRACSTPAARRRLVAAQLLAGRPQAEPSGDGAPSPRHGGRRDRGAPTSPPFAAAPCARGALDAHRPAAGAGRAEIAARRARGHGAAQRAARRAGRGRRRAAGWRWSSATR